MAFEQVVHMHLRSTCIVPASGIKEFFIDILIVDYS